MIKRERRARHPDYGEPSHLEALPSYAELRPKIVLPTMQLLQPSIVPNFEKKDIKMSKKPNRQELLSSKRLGVLDLEYILARVTFLLGPPIIFPFPRLHHLLRL